MGITIPVTILLASLIGIVWGLAQSPSRPTAAFLFGSLATLPVVRMLNDPRARRRPALTALVLFPGRLRGLGRCLAARVLPAWFAFRPLWPASPVALVLTPSAFELAHIHPFELSYYNSLIGGPRGAWRRGFELTYWFDAFNKETLDELNRVLPPGAMVEQPNTLTNPPTFNELQNLGALRGDIKMGINPGERQPDRFPFVWMQTQDSKASAFSRLLFAIALGTPASRSRSTACGW